ncbi:MAG: IS5 family transposase [Gemmatimonadales bacterium]|nr:IS5 family transposase [Gemmatimonadales bacterium]
MAKQRTFASLAWTTKGKVPRRERFLAEMDAVIPWLALIGLIEPCYPTPGRGRPPLGLEKMLRVYFVQQWFTLSDSQAEDALYDSEAIRHFVGVELGDDVVPDESTILRFRHLLARHPLTEAVFAAIRALLTAKRLLLQAGTIVDATIIHAPSSTKNAAHARDPEMQQTRKGQPWYFGMQRHVGTDLRGTVHHLTATRAGTADITQVPALLHGQERDLYGAQAYWSEAHRQHWTASGGRYRVNRRAPSRQQPLTRRQWLTNRRRSQRRARGEHAFHIVKRLCGFTTVRYRELAKNLARAFTLFGLANLYLLRRRLLPPGWEPCLT